MKANLVMKIVISVLLATGLALTFGRYISVDYWDFEKADAKVYDRTYEEMSDPAFAACADAVQKVFVDDDITDEGFWIIPGNEVGLNAYQLMDGLSYVNNTQGDRPDDEKYISDGVKKLAIFVYVAFIAAWVLAVAGLLFQWLGKKRRTYIFSAVSYGLSVLAMLSVLFIPVFLKHPFAKYLVDNSYTPGTISEVETQVRIFGQNFLVHAAGYGYWIFVACAACSLILAVVQYIVQYRVDNKVMYQPARYLNKRGTMIGVQGAYAGVLVSLDTPIVVGRDASCSHLIIEKQGISRRHCMVEYLAASQNYVVTDYSSNGTFIEGGMKLQKGVPTSIDPGAVIRFGNEIDSFRLM